MRGTVAKRIRREVYGKDLSPRARTYTEGPKSSRSFLAQKQSWENQFTGKVGDIVRKWFQVSGVVKSDPLRRKYQQRKQEHLRGAVQ